MVKNNEQLVVITKAGNMMFKRNVAILVFLMPTLSFCSEKPNGGRKWIVLNEFLNVKISAADDWDANTLHYAICRAIYVESFIKLVVDPNTLCFCDKK